MPLDLTQPWTELPLVVLDTETTGVNTATCGVVQVAAVRFERGQVVDRFVSLCKPSCSIPPSATAIHGITNEMVADAPRIEALAPELARVAGDAVPVAYNEGFDRRVLHRFLDDKAVPAWRWTAWICPLVIVREVERVVEGKGYYKLDATCARWSVPLAKAHDAGADAEAAGRLLWAMYEAGKIKPCSAARLLSHIQLRAGERAAMRGW